MEGRVIFRVVLSILVFATFCQQAACDLQSNLQKAEDALTTALTNIDAAILSAETQCPNCAGVDSDCSDSCVQDMVRALKEEFMPLRDTLDILQEKAVSICPRPCRLNKTTTGDPGFIVYDFGTNLLRTFLPNGTVLGSISSASGIRGMYHNPLTDTVFAFKESNIMSYNVNLEDAQVVSSTGFPSGSTGGLAGDPFEETLYMSFETAKELFKVQMDGTSLTRLVDSSNANTPFGIQIDACKGILYWADIFGNVLKSVNTEGTPNVTTLLETVAEDPIDLDVDFEDNKIYWCALSGSMLVLDMISGTNTFLAFTGDGNCNGLKLCNGFLYTTSFFDTGIRKHMLNGTFVEMLLDGFLGLATDKYFNLLLL